MINASAKDLTIIIFNRSFFFIKAKYKVLIIQIKKMIMIHMITAKSMNISTPMCSSAQDYFS